MSDMGNFDLPWGPPKRGGSSGGAKSEEDAMKLLEEAREHLIAEGYKIAVELAGKRGAVHSQMILAEMEHRGMLGEHNEKIPRNWTAVVFRGKDYKDSWEPCGYVKIGDSARNTHAAVRRLWKIKGRPDPTGFTLVYPNGPIDDVAEPGAPLRPTQAEIAETVDAYRAGLRTALQHGFKIKNPQAMRKVGLWLRYLAGEDVSAEVEAELAIPDPEPVGTCSVCGEPQFWTPGGSSCPNGHGGAPSLEEG